MVLANCNKRMSVHFTVQGQDESDVIVTALEQTLKTVVPRVEEMSEEQSTEHLQLLNNITIEYSSSTLNVHVTEMEPQDLEMPDLTEYNPERKRPTKRLTHMTRQGIEPGPLDQKLTLKPLSHHIRNLFGHVFSQQVVDERVVSSTNHGQPGILPTSNAQGELVPIHTTRSRQPSAIPAVPAAVLHVSP
ncbi:unnamed protein product [Pocillopora meandrina]|uniref:Uncharacterized protein n=1 Tax=Pocillopora meandrina TaxID=46732 RepID=A0AAU9Y3G1_9CNID|nr:unnamed protein product [Pocillopora meandrina]